MGLLFELAVVPAQTIRLFWRGWGLGAGGPGTGMGAPALAERALMQCGQLNGGRATSEHSCFTYAVRGEKLRVEIGELPLQQSCRQVGQGLKGHLSCRGQDHPDVAGQALEKTLA